MAEKKGWIVKLFINCHIGIISWVFKVTEFVFDIILSLFWRFGIPLWDGSKLADLVSGSLLGSEIVGKQERKNSWNLNMYVSYWRFLLRKFHKKIRRFYFCYKRAPPFLIVEELFFKIGDWKTWEPQEIDRHPAISHLKFAYFWPSASKRESSSVRAFSFSLLLFTQSNLSPSHYLCKNWLILSLQYLDAPVTCFLIEGFQVIL